MTQAEKLNLSLQEAKQPYQQDAAANNHYCYDSFYKEGCGSALYLHLVFRQYLLQLFLQVFARFSFCKDNVKEGAWNIFCLVFLKHVGNKHQLVCAQPPVASIYHIRDCPFPGKSAVVYCKADGVYVFSEGALQHSLRHNYVAGFQYRDVLTRYGRPEPQIVEVLGTDVSESGICGVPPTFRTDVVCGSCLLGQVNVYEVDARQIAIGNALENGRLVTDEAAVLSV